MTSVFYNSLNHCSKKRREKGGGQKKLLIVYAINLCSLLKAYYHKKYWGDSIKHFMGSLTPKKRLVLDLKKSLPPVLIAFLTCAVD